MFGWLFRKKRGERRGRGPADPIAAFDEALASIERQGVEVRRAAATLVALRAELKRDEAKYAARLPALEERIHAARGGGDEAAAHRLEVDLQEARRLSEKTTEALSHAEVNASLLLEAAEGLRREGAELAAERQSARARLSAGLEVSQALRARAAQFERVMRLDAARDEIERAHALAELYREDAGEG